MHGSPLVSSLTVPLRLLPGFIQTKRPPLRPRQRTQGGPKLVIYLNHWEKIMTKTLAAFRFTAESFSAEYRPCYFWTFTFTTVMPDWYYCRTWALFFRQLQDLYGGLLRGVKVLEFHKTHGVHYHCLLNVRIWVGEVRRIGKRYGIGIVHVIRARPDHVAYMAKYLEKDFHQKEQVFAKMARWGTVGGYQGTKVSNIKVEGRFQAHIARVQAFLGRKQLKPVVIDSLSNALRSNQEISDGVLLLACQAYRDNPTRFPLQTFISMEWGFNPDNVPF